ncbi:MAG: hypothetical protein KatS3mg115_2186 [Candidatus Poribacteria bacterium]|nr:MAG: hypothetical protein KatS3mg115_2186 [Candidatus Poribacteria bacterium]
MLEPIQRVLAQYGYPLSPRLVQGIIRYLANAQGLVELDEAIDRQLFQRILPRIKGHDENFYNLLQELLQHVPEERFPKTHRRLQQMADSEYGADFFHAVGNG